MLKPYIDINTKLRTEANNDFEKNFLKLMSNAVFRKNNGKCMKTYYINLVTIDKSRNQLVLEPNYHTKNYFWDNLMAIEMKKTRAKMNKPIFLDMSMLDISKTLMYKF